MHDAVNREETGEENRQHEIVHHAVVVERDQPEHFAARHALYAVLAMGERDLQGDEIAHLRQGERDHGEIDALATDRQRAGAQAQQAGDGGRREQAEFRRPAPHACGMGGDVGRGAEKQRVAEGEQAGIADQQVEGGGEQRETQGCREEERIEREGRRGEQRRQHGEGP